MGFIHRWARLAATTGAAPVADLIEAPPANTGLADWLTAGADDLIDALRDLPPDRPTWHPFAAPRVVAVWARRQANETMIHAWDAVDAVGGTISLDPAAAADNVAEYFEVIAPRILSRDGRSAPVGSLKVQCTDTGDEFVVRSDDGTSVAIRPSGASEAILAAPAEQLCLALWQRRGLPAAPDAPLAAAWLAFGGN